MAVVNLVPTEMILAKIVRPKELIIMNVKYS